MGNREALIWLFMKPIENLSLKDWSCIKLINGLIRNRLFIESRARDCQEVEELRRICCEEANGARQLRIELSLQKREESHYSESTFDSNSGLTE